MAKYKTFGELNENDYVFLTEIKKSNVIQDCVGSIYKRYIVVEKEPIKNNKRFMLTLVHDKSTFLKDWSYNKDADTTMVVFVDTTNDIERINNNTGRYIFLSILATNIEAINKELSLNIEHLEKHINETETYLKELKSNCYNLKTNISLRKDINPEYKNVNVKPIKQETITTEAVYV